MASRFLFNEALWDELGTRAPKAKQVNAAVAYLGSGASKLLPLREGDRLVVDMSLRAVRAGTTDPREVRKFLRAGVQVFSRGSLHAKFFILDRIVIAGSSNISIHARDALDEAAVLTDDAATVRRAAATFDDLCTEPVRNEYLKRCIEEYRPPKFAPRATTPAVRRKKLTQAKLWIVGGLHYLPLPEAEEQSAARVTKRVAKKLHDFERSEVQYSHYPAKQSYFEKLREGDWLITCVGDGKGFDVSPPARFLGVECIPRGTDKERYLVLYEATTDGEEVRWSSIRRSLPATVARGRGGKPRTMPVVDDADADAILRLWDSRGRFKPRRTA